MGYAGRQARRRSAIIKYFFHCMFRFYLVLKGGIKGAPRRCCWSLRGFRVLAEPEIDAMQISAFCVVAGVIGVGGSLGTQRFFIIFSRKEGNGHER